MPLILSKRIFPVDFTLRADSAIFHDTSKYFYSIQESKKRSTIIKEIVAKLSNLQISLGLTSK